MHSVHIVDVVVRAEAYQTVVGLCVLFVHEVRVVGRDNLDAVLMCQVDEDRIDLFLPLIDFYICARFLRLVPLDLNIIVFAEEVLEPLYGLFCFTEIAAFGDAVQDLLR